METVVIDRATWRRGAGKMKIGIVGDSKLLNKRGFRCCLGFHAGQLCGIADEDLQDRPMPSSLDIKAPGLREAPGESTPYAIVAQQINDDYILSEQKREKKLKAHAKEHGLRYTFVGHSPRGYWAH